jgi:hypothetical protein
MGQLIATDKKQQVVKEIRDDGKRQCLAKQLDSPEPVLCLQP